MLSFDRAEALYQDSAGVVPAGPAGNPLGLVLDQRYGLTRGAQLMRNADFATDISVWSTVNATRVWDNGRAFVTTSAGNGRMEQAIAGGLVAGRLYEVVGNLELGTAADVTLRAIRDAAGSYATIATSRQTTKGGPFDFRFTFVAPASDCIIQAATNDAAGTFWVDYIYIRDIQGSHFQQATATARPTRQQDAQGYWYANFDGTDDGLSSVTNVDETPFGYATTFMGVVLPTSDTTRILHETSNASASNNGATAILIDSSGLLASRTRGSAEVIVSGPTRVAGQKYLLTQIASVATSANGFVVNDTGYSNTAPPGGSVLGNYPHNISIRPGSLYLNSQIRAVIRVASVAPLSMTQRAVAQAWVRSKMGA